ncbi:MAG: heme exporter protein CcmB [Gemmatimonadetes bacterium]|nr:heme exporter protein CcmB [Gemmatimonadota bacterium]
MTDTASGEGPSPPDLPSPLLEARGLVRSYAGAPAVAGIDLTLRPGEVLCVFGPNGAGKTTLLRLLGGGLRPDRGEVRVAGSPLTGSLAARARVGVLSHQTFLYGHLTARENLRFYARLYGLADAEARITERLDGVGLGARADDRVSSFSRGMRQRLGLARTLLHDPDVVLLDEPYTGLDPHAAAVLRRVLEALRDGRRAVVLVTHNLSQGLELADRVAIQVGGRFVHVAEARALDPAHLEALYHEVVDSTEAGGAGGAPAPAVPGPEARGRSPSEASAVGLGAYVRQVAAVAGKDLLQELRTRERTISMAAFSVLVGVLFNYAIDPTVVRPQNIAAGLLWLTIVFGGVLGIGRTFQLEAEDGAFQGVLMSPAPRDALYLGKTLGNFVLLLGVALLVLAVFGVFFDLDFGQSPATLLGLVAVGSLGFVALGTLLAAVSTGTALGETLLPVLLFPLLVPVVIYGAGGTGRLLADRPVSEVAGTLRMLGAFATLAVGAGAVLFRFVVEE